MNAPKDILYIIPRPEIGGAERQLLMLMRGLDRTQFTPHVICLDGDGSLIDGYREAAETCRVLNRQRAFDREAIRTLTEEMKGLEPALVHTWLYIANLYGSVAARRAGISPLIVSQRGLGIDPQHSWLKVRQMRLFNRFIAHRADRLLVNARAVAKPMYDVGFTPEQTRVIYNGLNLDIEIKSEQQTALRAELGIQPTDILLAAIARIDPKKDLETMLHAFARVGKNESRARLLIAGGGFPEYQKKLEQLADRLNIRSCVSFLGFRNDPQAILSLCDISLLSSLTEGLPNAILESMALGKPVVATAVGGVPELIDDGVHGHLVPVGDHVQFANRICDLIANPERARRMGRAGQEKARCQFSDQTMVRNTENIYHELLGNPPDQISQTQHHLVSV